MMPDIDTFTAWTDEACERLPEVFFRDLNLGVVVSEDLKISPDAIDDDLFILGQYERSAMGKAIYIYYGSFVKMYEDWPEDDIKDMIYHVLKHEFTHHMEGLANYRDLEVEDEEQLARYKEMKKHDYK